MISATRKLAVIICMIAPRSSSPQSRAGSGDIKINSTAHRLRYVWSFLHTQGGSHNRAWMVLAALLCRLLSCCFHAYLCLLLTSHLAPFIKFLFSSFHQNPEVCDVRGTGVGGRGRASQKKGNGSHRSRYFNIPHRSIICVRHSGKCKTSQVSSAQSSCRAIT